MAYTPFHADWKDYPDTTTPVTGAALEHIETGVDNAHALIDDHLADTSDAHDASAISLLDAANDFTATDVEAAIAELQTRIEALQANATTAAWIMPVHLHTPATSVTAIAGNAFWTAIGLTDWDAGHWEFIKDLKGKLYGFVRIPEGLSTTANASLILEIGANATSGVTRMQVAHKTVADGVTMNPSALTDITAQDITMPGTAYFRKKVTFNITETIVAGDLLIVEVFHEGDHANDTLNANTILWGAWLSCRVAA